MKTTILTILIAGFFFATECKAQDWKWKPLPEGVMPNVPIFKIPNQGKNFFYKNPGDSVIRFRQAIPPRVYILPQDNMPCIVPDLSGINSIPNASPVIIPFRSRIPNAAPYRIPGITR